MRLIKASALLSVLLTAGCSDQSIQLPGTTKLLDDLPKVNNSPKSPCWQQEQIAAQNSYLATIKERKDIVYKAPCVVAPPKPNRVASAKPVS